MRLLHKLLREYSKGSAFAIHAAPFSKILHSRQRWLLYDKRERYNRTWHIC